MSNRRKPSYHGSWHTDPHCVMSVHSEALKGMLREFHREWQAGFRVCNESGCGVLPGVWGFWWRLVDFEYQKPVVQVPHGKAD